MSGHEEDDPDCRCVECDDRSDVICGPIAGSRALCSRKPGHSGPHRVMQWVEVPHSETPSDEPLLESELAELRRLYEYVGRPQYHSSQSCFNRLSTLFDVLEDKDGRPRHERRWIIMALAAVPSLVAETEALRALVDRYVRVIGELDAEIEKKTLDVEVQNATSAETKKLLTEAAAKVRLGKLIVVKHDDACYCEHCMWNRRVEGFAKMIEDMR